MHFYLIKTTSSHSYPLSTPHPPSPPRPSSFFHCVAPCHSPLGMLRNVVAWNLDLIALDINVMFLHPAAYSQPSTFPPAPFIYIYFFKRR